MSRKLQEATAHGTTKTTVGPIRWMVRAARTNFSRTHSNFYLGSRVLTHCQIQHEIRCLEFWNSVLGSTEW
jgi:hypothetical protein